MKSAALPDVRSRNNLKFVAGMEVVKFEPEKVMGVMSLGPVRIELTTLGLKVLSNTSRRPGDMSIVPVQTGFHSSHQLRSILTVSEALTDSVRTLRKRARCPRRFR